MIHNIHIYMHTYVCIYSGASLIRTPLGQFVLNSEVSSFQKLLSKCDRLKFPE